MKKISLTIIALLSLAMLAACSKHQTEETVLEPSTEEVVETTESSEASTTEEVTEDAENNDDGTVVYDGSIIKNTDHPGYNPYYDERQDDIKSDSIEKSDKDYRREEGKHYFERWCIYNSSDHECIVDVWLIDGTPYLLELTYYNQTSEFGLKDYVSSKDAVWDLIAVVVTDTNEEYQAMLSRITPDLNVLSLIDENWNSRY
ncbi:TPA: hypothetical protein U1B35_000695 [Streptococcus suis]|uniref:hypothetical protein n=1 Tax=Streptococcus suis TaxID=1307 RepID=UPI000D661355|nr:hypothetical protein [Streptococcus suis]AWL25262.1 hypothetical protein DF184_01285 [Streptococcus suis]NJW41955.1 hypothetical protein [Streptococcus suis]HEM3537030.1 hypothetical protein [Streptococcus suis]